MSDSSSGVTLEQVKKLLAERDVHCVNWLSSREREAAVKQPEIANDTPPVSAAITFEVHTSQPSATLPVSQPQFRMTLNYFSSQTVTPTNAMVAQPTYSDPIARIPSSAKLYLYK